MKHGKHNTVLKKFLALAVVVAMFFGTVPMTSMAESGGGAADVTVAVSDITDTTAKITITNNGATDQYPSGYCLVKKASEPAPTAEEIKGDTQDNQVADADFIQGKKREISKKIEDLTPGTEYVAYAIVYHGLKHGTPEAYSKVASAKFTTIAAAGAADVTVAVSDITDTTAKVTITNNGVTDQYPSGYCLVKKASEPAPTAEEVKEKGKQVIDAEFVQGKKKEIFEDIKDLNPDTEYIVYAIVYHGKKHGQPEAYSKVASAAFKTQAPQQGAEDDIIELSYKKASETNVTKEKYKDYTKAFEKVNALDSSVADVKVTILKDFKAKGATENGIGAIEIKRSCTLDLAGHVLKLETTKISSGEVYGILIIGKDTFFTIDDSSTSKSGQIEDIAGEGGTIRVGKETLNATPEEKTGNLIIKNGKISSVNAKYNQMIAANEDTSICIEGGVLNGSVFSYGEIDISGGRIEGECLGSLVATYYTGSINISGGKISNNLENDVIEGVTFAVSVNNSRKSAGGRKNLNITGGIISAKKAPALGISSDEKEDIKKPEISISGDTEIKSEEDSVIYFDFNQSLDAKYMELDIKDNVKLEGKRILEIIGKDGDNTKNLKFNISDGVKLKYTEAVPFLPNSSYITYTEGKVIATKPNADGYYEFVTAKDVKQKITIGGVEKEWGYQYLEEIERSIAGAKPIYDTKNAENKYNADLWTKFKKAYDEALPIPQNKNANQKEIDYFNDELGNAQAKMTGEAENAVDVSKLADGAYDVDIEMWLWNFKGFSMANSAVDHTARLNVKDGVGKLTVQMKPISILKYWGSLMQLWTFDGKNPPEAYANSAKSEKGQKTEANYLKYHNVPAAGGTPTPIDGKPAEAPSLENSIRPKTLEITLPYMGANNDYNKIYCYVAVDMMRALAGGPEGDQPVILYIKYSTLKPVDVNTTLITDADSLTIPEGGSKDIKTQLAGSGDLTGWTISAASGKDEIAKAEFENGKITVNGVKAGETDITVTAAKTGMDGIVKKVHVKVVEGTDAVKSNTAVSDKTATTEVTGSVLLNSGGENVEIEKGKIIVNAKLSSNPDIEDISVKISEKAIVAIANENKPMIIKTHAGNMELSIKAIEQMRSAGAVVIDLKNKAGKEDGEPVNNIDFKISKSKDGSEVKFNDGAILISTGVNEAPQGLPVYAFKIKNGKKVERVWMSRTDDVVSWNVNESGRWVLSHKEFKVEENTDPGQPGKPPVVPESKNGTWSVPIYVKNLSTGKASMANGAFSKYAVADVTDSGVTYTITLQGMKLQGLKGHLLNLWYYKEYPNSKEEASYTTYNDTGLNGEMQTFPRTVTFTMNGKPTDEVYIRVNVDAMNEAAIGAGQQDALLMFDWQNATKGSGNADSSNSEMDEGKQDELKKDEKKLTPEEQKKQEAKADEILSKANIVDVSKHWAKKSIAYVVEKNLFKGVSTATGKDGKTVNNFEPESNMTRSMVVTVLHRLAGTPAVTANAGMADVKSGTWYENAVNWAVSQKIVNGVGENRFAPDRPITREAFVTMLYNYAKTNNPKMNKMGDISKFKDASSVSSWAKDALQWAVGMGFLTGNDKGELSPAKSITRAEVASIFERYLKTVEAEKAKIEKEKAEKAKTDKK